MAKRTAISKKLRFEVFKRDSFRCQYCGAEAPGVLLVIDHIQPVARGGPDDIANLITACFGCNSGKSDRLLSDASAVTVAKAQLDQLQQRREQIELMLEWKRGLANLAEETTGKVVQYWAERTGYEPATSEGRSELAKTIKRYGAEEVIEAIDRAVDSYLLRDENGAATAESAGKAFSKLGSICRVERETKKNPDLGEMYYVRGILRNRFAYLNDWRAMELMKEARAAGVPMQMMRDEARECFSWSGWRYAIEHAIGAAAQNGAGE